jgi:predicted MFS family arabinose efflux permease
VSAMFPKMYRRYVLGTLTLVFTFVYLDRYLIMLLLQSIKEDLRLSDTQLGFLTGIAFGLFYATLGLPIARWADRGNRATIVSIALALWGGTVMSCLFVTKFAQLLVVRVATAIGESGCMPPTYSLVGDYFPAPAEGARAMTVYWLANPLAALISFIVGGWLSDLYGWRITFFVMGIPAVLVAVIVKMTIHEPRMHLNQEQEPHGELPSLAQVVTTLWCQRSSRHLGIAIILLFAMSLGLAPWYAAFMMRSHGMDTAEVGLWLGPIFGICGIVGITSGGYILARWFGDDERAQMRLSAVVIASLVPCFILFLLLPDKHAALIALIPLVVVFSFFLGPTFALLQRLVVDEMRATTLAVVMLLANLIGMGLGPQVVGILSDFLKPVLGNDSLRYAMLAMSSVALWSAYHFWQVGVTVKEDLVAIANHTGLGPTAFHGRRAQHALK